MQQSTVWPSGPVRRASVNSIGYGGANAHTILESVDSLAPGHGGARARAISMNDSTNGYSNRSTNVHLNGISNGTTNGYSNGTTHVHLNGVSNGTTNGHVGTSSAVQRRLSLLPFPAHNKMTVHANMGVLRSRIDQWNLLDLSYTLGCRRAFFSTRSFAVAEQDCVGSCLSEDRMPIRKLGSSNTLKHGFVFTGKSVFQSPLSFSDFQYARVHSGRRWVCKPWTIFRYTYSPFEIWIVSFPVLPLSPAGPLKVCIYSQSQPYQCKTSCMTESLRAAPQSSRVYQASMSQVLITAVQIALVNTLISWDVRSSVSIGHSSGEIAASYASGRLSSAEAIIAAYTRGRAVSRNKLKGAMPAVALDADAVSPFLRDFDAIEIACYNSPQSLTLSGDEDQIVALEHNLKVSGIFARILSTDGNAYYFHHMKPLGSIYQTELTDILSQVSAVDLTERHPLSKFVSTVTGKDYPKSSIDPRHWRSNLESPVRFHQTMLEVASTTSPDLLIEFGPHTALQSPIRQIAKPVPGVSSQNICRRLSGRKTVLLAFCKPLETYF